MIRIFEELQHQFPGEKILDVLSDPVNQFEEGIVAGRQKNTADNLAALAGLDSAKVGAISYILGEAGTWDIKVENETIRIDLPKDGVGREFRIEMMPIENNEANLVAIDRRKQHKHIDLVVDAHIRPTEMLGRKISLEANPYATDTVASGLLAVLMISGTVNDLGKEKFSGEAYREYVELVKAMSFLKMNAMTAILAAHGNEGRTERTFSILKNLANSDK